MKSNLIDYLCAFNMSYVPAWYHWTIAEKLKKVVDGECKRLIITLPPRHGKSEICSKGFPSWFLGIKNSIPRSIIAASYSAKLSTSFGRIARNWANHPFYQFAFDTKLDRNIGMAASDWTLDNGNSYYAAGVGGGITGFGADIFLIDDPIKNRQQADSSTWRENLKDWYREVALTRLTPQGAVVIIMTRWHYDDLVGWLLREYADEQWEELKFPALQTEHDMGERKYDHREPGEPLWKDKYTLPIINDLQEALGPMSFNCLYQQDPTIEGGAVLNINDLVQDYNLDDLKEHEDEEMMWLDHVTSRVYFQRIISSWDTAFESKSTADYSVGTVWGDSGKAYYLLDIVRGRWRFPDLKKKMISTNRRWNEDAVLIEAKASGKDLLYELQAQTGIPVQPVNPVMDKVNRAAAISGRIEAGRVHIPKTAPWLREFLTELEHFPKVDHDDQVDSFTQAIRWMSRYGGPAMGVV